MRTVRTVKYFGPRQWLVIAALLFVLAFTAFFALRAAKGILYWDMRQEEPIRRWMTIPYIARLRSVPEAVLNKAAGLPEDAHDPRPLIKIAKSQNRHVRALEEELENAVVEYHAFNPSAEGTP
jgi:hypothetical protein